MFLKIFINYILGYVNIRVESFYLERFINTCIKDKIFLWNIKRKKSSMLYGNISIRDYKKLKSIAKKTQSVVKIKSKKGLPFLLHKYRKRKIFFGFLVIIIVFFIIVSNYIWNIEIEGNVNISKEELIEELERNGLKMGTSKNKINTTSIISNIRFARNDIAWIGINIKGTNAFVEIRETKKAPETIQEDEYCNIISNKTGVITKIFVQNGTANVKEGDIINPGDVIVLGYLEGKYTGIRYVHAVASVEAKVWYTKKEKFYYKSTVKEPTGATEQRYTIIFNNFKINFYKTLSKFKNYDTIEENKKLSIFSNFYLPIEISKKTNFEYQNKEKIYTEEELKDIGIAKIEEELKSKIEKEENIINKQINTYGNEEYIEIEVTYEVIEPVGVEDKILF